MDCRYGLLVAVLLTGAAAAEPVAHASLFQGKTVTMVIGYAAGGGTDTFGRLTAGLPTSTRATATASRAVGMAK